MKREYLELMNSILEHVHRMGPEDQFKLYESLMQDGFGYPEKSLSRLQEEVTDRLSQFS